MLKSNTTKSYVAGTTNSIFFHHKSDIDIDVLVNVSHKRTNGWPGGRGLANLFTSLKGRNRNLWILRPKAPVDCKPDSCRSQMDGEHCQGGIRYLGYKRPVKAYAKHLPWIRWLPSGEVWRIRPLSIIKHKACSRYERPVLNSRWSCFFYYFECDDGWWSSYFRRRYARWW